MPLLVLLLTLTLAAGDPQTNLLDNNCSPYSTTIPSYSSSLNSSFIDLRSQLNSSSSATAVSGRGTDAVYSLFYCRPYLSSPDCLSCFSAAVSTLRSCRLAKGARVVFDGCFLRYRTSPFFTQTSMRGKLAVCGNSSEKLGFPGDVEDLLRDLSLATPRIDGYFAAARRGRIYAVAQCARTVSVGGCGGCLTTAYANAKQCLPETEGRAVDAGCFMRYSEVDFFGKYHTVDLKNYLESGGSSNKWAIIGGVTGGVIGLCLLCLVLFLWIRTRKLKKARKGDILGATELQGPLNFHYNDLKSATRNFSEETKLGKGGFGDVHKGVLSNGKIVAVKKLSVAQTSRAKADFESEVKLISNVHHRNLVRLLGCSSKGPDLLLVYEYMANSSLDRFLYGERRGTLNWKQRFNIILGMARGLAYLHQEFHVCIIHRDIKSSNVLLDDDFLPKIADFGLARLLPGDQSHLSTKFAGTLGYTAPEYAMQGQLSEKVDTYSYGVVVLEIISGRKINAAGLEHEAQYLLEWAWKLYESGDSIMLVDESMCFETYNRDEVMRIIQIALLCTQSTVSLRPTMTEVVVYLLSESRTLVHPTKPTFIGDYRGSDGNASTATVSAVQVSAR